MRSTPASIARARSVKSARLPIGVPTTYKCTALGASDLFSKFCVTRRSPNPSSAIRNPQLLPPRRLTHARNLPFPALRTAPRNRGLGWGIGAATADDGADSQEQEREDGLFEVGHG